MNINPLFLNSLGGQAIETDSKSKKFDAPAYLFSDIIKIYTDDKQADITSTQSNENISTTAADGSEDIINLNSLFEQINKKIDSPFNAIDSSDISETDDTNVTVFKYVFEELNNTTNVDSAGDIKLDSDGSTHISDVNINALVSNIINLIQNSGIASTFDKNFNSEAITAFLESGGNVDLNIKTSDGVIKLSFEQNANLNGETPASVPNTSGDSIESGKISVDKLQQDAKNPAGISNNEDINKQMSLKIAVFKDAGKSEPELTIKDNLQIPVPPEVDQSYVDNTVNSDSVQSNANVDSASKVNTQEVNSTNPAIVNDTIPSGSENAPSEKYSNTNISSAKTGIGDVADNLQDDSNISDVSKKVISQSDVNTSSKLEVNQENSAQTKIEVNIPSDLVSKNKESVSSEDLTAQINTLAQDKNIKDISYSESPQNTTNKTDKNSVKQQEAKLNDLPLFSSEENAETKQVNISQNADNQVELPESMKGDGVTGIDTNGNKINGKIEEPQVGVVNQEENGLPINETTSKQEAQIIDVKQETVTSNNNTKNSNIKTENQGDLSGIKTVKQDISEETNSAATIKDKTIDTKDNTNITVNEKPIVNVNANKTLSNNDKIDSPESNSGNEIAKGKITIENSSTDNKPAISVDGTANEDNVNNIDQNADKENTIELKSIPVNSKIKLQGDKEISVKFNTQSKVNEIKLTKDDPVRVEPKVETKPTEQKIQAENTGSFVKEKTFTESQPVEQEIKTTKQFDIRLNSSKSISSLDILSKVHQFISDNAFADKPIGLSTDVSDSKSNNLNTDSSTAFLSSLNEFTKDNDISLLHNKSNFILQKQNFNNKNADSKLSNNKSEDINITAKTDTKVDNLPLNSEHNNKEQKTINENTKPEISKITAEDKILADAEEKLNQNLPVNEKKVFTPDFSLINPLTAKESSKIETVKNVNSTVKINEPVTNSTKPTTDKNSSDSSTGKETRDSNENSAFNISHTNAAEKISDKQSSIHEDIKFIPQEEKMVKYSRLMPEIKNALSEGVNKSLTLSLMPEELGRVKLMVETVDKTVTAKIEVQNEAVQTTVQNNLDNLKQSLSQAGISVNNITVSISYNENKQQKPGELKRKNSGANDKKVDTENEKIANTSPSKTLGYNTYEYLA